MPAIADLSAARANMLVNQIRAWQVLDERVLAAVEATAREAFVPVAHRALAYADLEVPLGHGQRMWPPKVEARMVQALNLRRTDAVLEIGTGSGYVTALLARLGAYVTSVELFPDLSASAGAALAAHGVRNVRLEIGNAAAGWPDNGPYDAILVTGSVPELPAALLDSLRPGGRLGIVVGRAPVMQALLVVCDGPGQFRQEALFETVLPPLEHVNLKPGFEF